MSMLSSMCENLRIMARLVREYDYREISRSLREAADTIDELRCRCQDANGENEKLGEELEELRAENDRLRRFAEYDENAIDILNVCTDDLSVENDKLRELVRELWECHNDPRCEDCLEDAQKCADCPVDAREIDVIDRMRELGIEVDG